MAIAFIFLVAAICGTLVMGVFYLIDREFKNFTISSLIMVIAILLTIGMFNWEIQQMSVRSPKNNVGIIEGITSNTIHISDAEYQFNENVDLEKLQINQPVTFSYVESELITNIVVDIQPLLNCGE